jgi:hypothetical protein
MRMVRLLAAALAAAMALTACMPRPAPPASAPAPPPRPAPPPPAPAPPPSDWRDAPLSQGDWGYGDRPGPRAAFGAEGPFFVAECTIAGQVALARVGAAAGATLTIGTTFGERSLPASSDGATLRATLAAADPLLDEMAFSRGRLLVHTDGQADLVLPSWPELARLIEECRQ